MNANLDDFQGSADEYVRYLEQTVLCLRRQLFPLASIMWPGLKRNAWITARNHWANERRHTVATNPTASLRRRTGQPKVTAVWRKTVSALIASTPTRKLWTWYVEELRYRPAISSGYAINFLLDSAHDSFIPEDQLRATNEEYQIYRSEDIMTLRNLGGYATATALCPSESELDQSLIQLRRLVLLSACAVLQDLGFSSGSVCLVAQPSLGDITVDYLQRIARAAVWVNKLLDNLETKGWGQNAVELLLIWNRPLSFYIPLKVAAEESLKQLSHELEEFREYAPSNAQTNSMRIFMPAVVNIVLGGRIHIARIAKILGYKYAEVLEAEEQEHIGENPWSFFNGIDVTG